MKTPRTDAERRALKKAKSYPPDPVSAEFARQLERELQSMTALADRLAEAIAHSPYDESLAEALAAYEKHKKTEQQIKQPCDCIEKCGKYWIQRCDCQNSTSLAEAQSWCDQENHKKQTP
jgi:hypothetical protein